MMKNVFKKGLPILTWYPCCYTLKREHKQCHYQYKIHVEWNISAVTQRVNHGNGQNYMTTHPFYFVLLCAAAARLCVFTDEALILSQAAEQWINHLLSIHFYYIISSFCHLKDQDMSGCDLQYLNMTSLLLKANIYSKGRYLTV